MACYHATYGPFHLKYVPKIITTFDCDIMKLEFYLHNDNNVIIITLLIEASVIQVYIVCFNNLYQHQLNHFNKSEIILMDIHIYREMFVTSYIYEYIICILYFYKLCRTFYMF